MVIKAMLIIMKLLALVLDLNIDLSQVDKT